MKPQREKLFNDIRQIVESAGFIFEKSQRPHRQNRNEQELVFVHPRLLNRFGEDGFSIRATKFYIKPLSDDPGCEIGFVTGITSPLHDDTLFAAPNGVDTHKNTPAWVNREGDKSIDLLMKTINAYLAPG